MTRFLDRLNAAARRRILILDGSWGVMIQRQELSEEDFRGERFAHHNMPLKGDNDLLCLTRPSLVTELHDAYFEAGADIGETNTFNATRISQSDYGLQDAARDINLAAARLARESADRWTAMTASWAARSARSAARSRCLRTSMILARAASPSTRFTPPTSNRRWRCRRAAWISS
jgi:methionine synthase I (cobalamin-dependent)